MALRTPLSVTPHLYMGDSTGRPLDNGVVYFGEQDKDPEFYPINLFSDDALTKPLMQPVHTKGGYLYDKGDMVEPHAKELIYSVKVLDSYGRKVFYKGAMMRNSWNDDVIEQINTAIIESQVEAQVIFDNAATDVKNKAIDIVNDAINNTAVEGGVLADTFVVVDATLNQRQINKGFESVADMLNIPNPKTGLRVYVKSYHAGLGKGGGTFIYDSSKSSTNNEGTIINGWVRNKESLCTPYMFGAYGDGVTDDTTALNNLFKLCRNILIPDEGVFFFSHYLLIRSDTHITGFGKLLQKTPNPAEAILIRPSKINEESIKNVHISNITLDCQELLPYPYGDKKGYGGGVYIDGDSQNITLDNVTIMNTSKDGIYIREAVKRPRDIIIQNCSIINSSRSGASVVGGDFIQFRNNRVIGYNLAGFNCEAHPPATGSSNIVVADNFFDTNSDNTVFGSIGFKNAYGLSKDVFHSFVVRNNTVIQNSNRPTHAAIYCENAENSLCDFNAIYNTSSGIRGFNYITNNLITGTADIKEAIPTSDTPPSAISTHSSSPTYITNNRIIDYGYCGILAYSNSIIEGNYIKNIGLSEIDTNHVFVRIGIYVQGGANLITSNIFDADSENSFRYSIRVRGGDNNNIIKDSIYRGLAVGTSDLMDAGTTRIYNRTDSSKSLLGVAPPTTGDWSVGDTIINQVKEFGKPISWVCIKGGSFSTGDEPEFIATYYAVPEDPIPNQSGPSTSRPVSPDIGQQYFDTSLSKPIYWGGTEWVDSSGEVV